MMNLSVRLNRMWCCVLVAGLLGVMMSGCQMMANERNQDCEQELSAAGFSHKLADTPEKMSKLESLPQRKLVPFSKDDKTYYFYADAKTKSLYLGNDKAYQNYQKIEVQYRIASENIMAAEEAASHDWNAWGPDW